MTKIDHIIDAPTDASTREELESAVVRFAGDSGDGMQLTGGQFTQATALAGNDLATFPDFPAEIRAPVGTTFGVSSFQINFGANRIMTSGDDFDVLVAMNPAALMVEMPRLKKGGLLIVDTGSFTERNLIKASFDENPLEDHTLDAFNVVPLDISGMTQEAVKNFNVSKKEALRCKNMWALGFVYWLFARPRKSTQDWLQTKFASKPDIAGANVAALNAGHAMAETAEMPMRVHGFHIAPAKIDPGLYRTVTGAEALAWGLAKGSELADLDMLFASYPITPASPLLHNLAKMQHLGITTFQAEDEIAAVCAAIGASYAGTLGVTSSSGPGIALKGEAIGLALSAELPLVIVNSQRGGPSTGLPTKTEQSDLYQAVFGRNGDSPLVVLSTRSASVCFEVGIEAVRLAVKYMTPVMLLTDGYIANAAEPWRLPDLKAITPFPVAFHQDPEGFHPFLRDEETLSRVWAKPGTPDLLHRIGGIERSYDTGHISYDADNHQKMTNVRRDKINGIAKDIPEQTVELGPTSGKVCVVGWGSTYGPINRAVDDLLKMGKEVAHIHLRHIWPMPSNLGDLLSGFEYVLVPEMNDGQLITVLRSEYLIDAHGLNKVSGQPFKIAEIEDAILTVLEG
jgi:2-oxoglutarate ferredoxin oxidoreductase subunit alpha